MRISHLAILTVGLSVGSNVDAQGTAPGATPDTAAERFFVGRILGVSDARVTRAPGDTAVRVFRFKYPSGDSARWSRYEDFILRSLHARRITDADDRTYEIGIVRLTVAADTLTGRFMIGQRQRCPTDPWVGGDRVYEMQAVRTANGWTELSTRGVAWGDTRRCR